MAGNDEVADFFSSWQQLSPENKAKGLVAFAKRQPHATTSTHATSLAAVTTTPVKSSPTTTYDGVQLYSYYSYLYYYPTIHWNLDRTPETDDYWIGIYPKEADNYHYITYQWLNKTAQGSYNVGRLGLKAGLKSRERSEEFELRLFKGAYRRVDVQTNVLRGAIQDAPTNPDRQTSNVRAPIEIKELDAEIRAFLQATQNLQSPRGASVAKAQVLSLQDLHKQWKAFSSHQQQLLYPVLEQDALPDRIKKPGPKAIDRPEPRVAFPTLNKNQPLSLVSDSDRIPQKIVLSITLNESYTYIYPVVNVAEVVPTKYAWMGMYHTQSNVAFNSDDYIDNDWQWVGNGYQGSTNLNYVKETDKGPLQNQYLGVIFDWIDGAYVQVGLASSTILASVSVTAEIPPPDFQPDFDKSTALLYAKLSQLAYKPYTTVQQTLPTFNLKAEMQIYDASSDTNGFIASNDSSVVVVFRGTDIKSWKNIFTDLWFIRKKIITEGNSYAHGGFITAFNTVYTSIESNLRPRLGKKQLFIAGHSLGGALASLLTYRISFEYPEAQPAMYVYGCPPVGDYNFATYFRGMESNTITIQNDPISSGQLILLGPRVGLYKPMQVKYLPKAAGHAISDYIQQLENLSD